MTKKTFILAAKLANDIADPVERWQAVKLLVRLFSAENPRFDRNRFCQACGVPNFVG